MSRYLCLEEPIVFGAGNWLMLKGDLGMLLPNLHYRLKGHQPDQPLLGFGSVSTRTT